MSWWHRMLGRPDPDRRDPRATPGPAGSSAPTIPVYRPPGTWGMDDIEAALDQLEYGAFYSAGRLADALLVDEDVAALIGLRIGTATGLPGYFERPSAPGERFELRGLPEDWQLVFPVEEQDQVLFQTLIMGFSLAYDTRESYNDLPQWKAWPSYGVRYDVGREVWQVEDRLRGLIDVYPGDGRWALFAQRSSRPWLAGYIRALAPLMAIRQSTLFSWAHHANVYATPARILKAPARMAETKDVKKALTKLKELVGDTTFQLLDGMSIELLELKEVTYQIYQQLRAAVDQSMAIMLVGQLGTTKAAGGWGAAHTERRVTQQLLERDVKILSHTAWRDILAPYDRWKRGTVDLLKVPRYVWDATPPADLDALAKRRALQAQADLQQAQELAALAKLDFGDGWVVDMKRVCEDKKIPLRRRKTAELPPAPPSAAAQEAA